MIQCRYIQSIRERSPFLAIFTDGDIHHIAVILYSGDKTFADSIWQFYFLFCILIYRECLSVGSDSGVCFLTFKLDETGSIAFTDFDLHLCFILFIAHIHQ